MSAPNGMDSPERLSLTTLLEVYKKHNQALMEANIMLEARLLERDLQARERELPDVPHR